MKSAFGVEHLSKAMTPHEKRRAKQAAGVTAVAAGGAVLGRRVAGTSFIASPKVAAKVTPKLRNSEEAAERGYQIARRVGTDTGAAAGAAGGLGYIGAKSKKKR